MTEQEPLLTRLQDEHSGLKSRREANRRVEEVVASHLKENGASSVVASDGKVILDVPLRNIDLGGAIYVRESDGSIRSIDQVSATVRELALGFGRMSKALRVYVAPEVRDAIPAEAWTEPSVVARLTNAVLGKAAPGEVR